MYCIQTYPMSAFAGTFAVACRNDLAACFKPKFHEFFKSKGKIRQRIVENWAELRVFFASKASNGPSILHKINMKNTALRVLTLQIPLGIHKSKTLKCVFENMLENMSAWLRFKSTFYEIVSVKETLARELYRIGFPFSLKVPMADCHNLSSPGALLALVTMSWLKLERCKLGLEGNLTPETRKHSDLQNTSCWAHGIHGYHLIRPILQNTYTKSKV